MQPREGRAGYGGYLGNNSPIMCNVRRHGERTRHSMPYRVMMATAGAQGQAVVFAIRFGFVVAAGGYKDDHMTDVVWQQADQITLIGKAR